MSDYVKSDDLGLVIQLNNFKDKLPNYATVLGLSAGTVTAAVNDATFFGFSVSAVETASTYKQSWTELKIAVRKGKDPGPIASFPTPVNILTTPTAVAPGVEERFRALVKQIKANPAYTQAMGEDLGIVAAANTAELTAPVLSVKLEGGIPVIGFKKGKSGGIKLYSKRGAETEFSFLAIDTKSPYVDNRPNLNPATPETREYSAYFIVDDQQVGTQSTVVNITVK